jgi:uncharacterized membrane protein
MNKLKEDNFMRTKDVTLTGLMAALVFVGTYCFKIPSPLTMGYTHLGDCMIFLAIYLFGWKRGAMAGAIGAALSDLLGGFMIWVVPTFLIKGLMGIAIGLLYEQLFRNKKKFVVISFLLGGIVQMIGYTGVKVVLFGWQTALGSVPGLTGQTLTGIILASVMIFCLEKGHLVTKIQQMEA